MDTTVKPELGVGQGPHPRVSHICSSLCRHGLTFSRVNIGGLFVIEPFITPAFFQRYAPATDEWELSLAMAADTAGGGLSQLEEHYKTFITEKDIADIAGAGLNWIRLPIPFWAIETYDGEPFLERVCWK